MPDYGSKDPLHGVTLERMVVELVEFYGWEELAKRTNIRAFRDAPTVSASLKLLRKTPWARTKIEELYLYMLRKHRH